MHRFPNTLLALLVTTSSMTSTGCYDMHGRLPGDPPPDSGLGGPRDVGTRADAPPIDLLDGWGPPPPPPPDGGAACSGAPLPGHPSALVCPESAASGEAVVVTLSHYAGACCADSGALPTVVRPGRDTPDFGLFPEWSACECCELCGCVGGVATEAITLGAFSAGDVVNVTAGDLHCSIPITGPPLACVSAPASRWLVPAAVRAGDPIPVGVISERAGCGCTPRIAGPPRGGSTVALSLCGCCEDCFCIDPPADGTVLVAPTTPGPWEWSSPTGERSPIVRAVATPETSCLPATITSASLVAPLPSSRMSATPDAVWLHLEMDVLACCLTPLPFVATDSLRGGPPQFSLRAYECGADPCDCDTPNVFHTATDHFLGTWPAGDYAVALGGTLPPLRFTLP